MTHRHKWNVKGRQADGAIRVCYACGARSRKIKGRWVRVDA